LVFFSIILVFLVLLISAVFFVFRTAFFPKRYTHAEALKIEIDSGSIRNFDEYNSWPKEEFSVPSPDGYNLHCLFFPTEKSLKTMILSHGIGMNYSSSIPYMGLFRRLGYNLLIYDHRFHGSSGGKNCTFGYFEKYDLKSILDWVLRRTGPNSTIGTHGISLGGAITIQHAEIDPRISFAISDCSFSDLKKIFELRLKVDYHLPGFPFFMLARWFGKALIGFDFYQVSPIRDLDKTSTPIFFIHGDKDGYIPPSMSIDMIHAKTTGPTRLYLAPGAKHAQSYLSNPAEYENQIKAFMEQIGA
jgi:hypothetical protein